LKSRFAVPISLCDFLSVSFLFHDPVEADLDNDR